MLKILHCTKDDLILSIISKSVLKFSQMSKRKPIIVTVAIIIVLGVLIWSRLLTFNKICGWSSTQFAKDKAKEQGSFIGNDWPCICLGIPKPISNSYETTVYCTGINLSYNKLLNLPFFSTKQTPLYSNKSQWTLQIQVVNMKVGGSETPVTGASVAVYNNTNKLMKEASLSKQGKAEFILPEGSYKVEMKSGYTGQKEIVLDRNKSIKLEVIRVLR